MRTPNTIIEGQEFEIRQAEDPPDLLELVVTTTGTHLVKGIIPDGQLAGQEGHLMRPFTSTSVWPLYPQQAGRLLEQIGLLLSGGMGPGVTWSSEDPPPDRGRVARWVGKLTESEPFHTALRTLGWTPPPGADR